MTVSASVLAFVTWNIVNFELVYYAVVVLVLSSIRNEVM